MAEIPLQTILKNILHTHGAEVFGNPSRVYALLLDLLSRDRARERLLVRHFVEAGGFAALQKSDYTIARNQIRRTLVEDFSLAPDAARWVIETFAAVLGIAEDVPKRILEVSKKSPVVDTVLVPYVDNAELRQGRVAIGKNHAAVVLANGSADARGRNAHLQCDVGSWQGIIAIAAGDAHTVGLQNDGRVVAVGRNDHYQCQVGHWRDIVSVYAFGNATFGIRTDGTVITTDTELDLHFTDVAQLAWHPEGVLGIRNDGRVVYSLRNMEITDYMPQANLRELEWFLSLTDVQHLVTTYTQGSFALRKGDMYKFGEDPTYAQSVTQMVGLAEGCAVLRTDGTVRILSYDRHKAALPSYANGWRDITALYGHYKVLVGADHHGRLRAVSTDYDWLQSHKGFLDYFDEWVL